MKIIVTIPAYNEQRDIVGTIEDIQQVMKKTKYSYSILVVNDGSTDRTAALAKKAGAHVITNKRNLGLHETFKVEMKECLAQKADIIVHTDADGQYPAKYIPQLISRIEKGADLAIGTRFGKGSYSGALSKKLGNKAFALVFSRLLRQKITDTTSGFRAFTPEVASLPIINQFTYTQEQLIRAGKSHFKVVEVPITTRKTRKSRLFRNVFDYALKSWINILRIYRDYEPLKFFGLLGVGIFSVGFIIGLYLVYLHFTSGISGHFGLMMLDVALLSIGLQIIIFGFLADMNRK